MSVTFGRDQGVGGRGVRETNNEGRRRCGTGGRTGKVNEVIMVKAKDEVQVTRAAVQISDADGNESGFQD